MPCPGPSRPGSALVLALWMALLIGTAGSAALLLAGAGAGAARGEADLARARAAAEGGLWSAAHRLAATPPAARPPGETYDLALGGAAVRVRLADEDGRIDLNTVAEPLLAALFGEAGLAEPQARQAAARLLAWRERSSDPGGGRRRLRSLGEALLAAGLPLALVERLRGAATVHSGLSRPAEEAAPPAALAVLRRDAAALALPVLMPGRYRTPQPGGTQGGRRRIWRIEAEGRFGATTARMAMVLAVAPAAGMPGQVLEWLPVAAASGP